MRYSYEYKLKCVEMYRKGEYPETPEGVSKKKFREKIHCWARKEEAYTPEALKHPAHNSNRTPEKKWSWSQECLQENHITQLLFQKE